MASEQPRSRRALTVGHMSFSSDCRSQKIARRELLALLRRWVSACMFFLLL